MKNGKYLLSYLLFLTTPGLYAFAQTSPLSTGDLKWVNQTKPAQSAPSPFPQSQSAVVKKDLTLENTATNETIFGFYYLNTILNCTDLTTLNTAAIATQYNLGLSLDLYREWKRNHQILYQLKGGFANFKQTDSSEEQLVKTQAFQWLIALGDSFTIHQNFRLESSLNLKNELILVPHTTNDFTIESVLVASLSEKLLLDLWQTKNFKLGGSATLELIAPSRRDDTDTHTSFALGGAIYVQNLPKDQNHLRYQGEIGVMNTNLNTSVYSQSEIDFAFLLKVFFKSSSEKPSGY